MHVNAKQIWQTAIERLQTKVHPTVFTTWFQGTAAHSFQDGVFTVRVPTTFAKAHLEGRFLESIRSILSEVTDNKEVEVQFVVAKQTADQSGSAPEMTHPANKPPIRPTKGRPSAAQRETRIADAAATAAMQAMTSIAP